MMLRKVILTIILFSVVGIIAYRLGRKSYLPPTTSSTTEVEDKFTCPQYFDGGIYKQYVKSANEIEVVDKPKLVENPQVVKMSKPFIVKEFEKGLYKYDNNDNGWDFREFDVDADGKKEKIISGNTAMNHTPHLALIVKDENIIFEAPEAANNYIYDFNNGQGFILSKTVDWNTGETLSTTYIYKDGGFIPIWTQKACWVTFK